MWKHGNALNSERIGEVTIILADTIVGSVKFYIIEKMYKIKIYQENTCRTGLIHL